MGVISDSGGHVNVYETPFFGRLDRTGEKDALNDASRIRIYIRAAKESAASPGRQPAIARPVLTSIWEAPRISYHLEAKKNFAHDLRNKLLWAPWSVEAAERWNQTHSVRGLVLEHVTPIEAMWQKLTKLDDDFEDPNSELYPDPERGGSQHGWDAHAVEYLIRQWTVAVLTREQASAIDNCKGLKTSATEPNPFARYFSAEMQMDRARAQGLDIPSFSTSRFILSGHAKDLVR